MNHYELPVGAFLAVVLALLPLPWHWKARNVATLSLIAWLVVVNLCRGVNSIIWLDNVRIHAHWWCDISTKLFIGISTALPASSFCITRNLEHIASTRVAVTTAADKRRRRNIDLCITVGFPVLTMILHYVVQGHRFDIVDYVGCQPAIYVSIPALFILYIPPLVLSVGSLTFASLALRHFLIRRVEFERHLRDSQSALTTSRYMRLMALAVCEIFWGTTLGAYVVFLNISVDGLRPWTSWADVHYNFSRVAVYPRYLIGSWQKQNLFLSWWITPATALLFFIFFGFSEEALEGYAGALRWVRRVVFRQTITQTTSGTGTGTYGASFGKNTMPRFTYVPPFIVCRR
ncbi:fungal pheromone STE3G-protein-coupled receptor [Exidia glandulosa HHB12029]|uniref:Fungal pheromone STE3G-protein-coupled receptor n=1 Tax=Exidia glandulosa HHB12029 TaxID=1314781 RepID=A0A165ZEP6_EXIGL|nr:fungal pheromone STE3G-protein-coupled receptor [Exidia glandulosa HHB12029]